MVKRGLAIAAGYAGGCSFGWFGLLVLLLVLFLVVGFVFLVSSTAIATFLVVVFLLLFLNILTACAAVDLLEAFLERVLVAAEDGDDLLPRLALSLHTLEGGIVFVGEGCTCFFLRGRHVVSIL